MLNRVSTVLLRQFSALFLLGIIVTPVHGKVAETTDAAPTIRIERFSFDGNTVFSNEELDVVILHYLDTPLQVEDIYAAADELTRFYQAKGYGLASVILPPQDISDGTVAFEIIEGLIDRVIVSGSAGKEIAEISPHIDSLKPGRIFHADAVQEELLALNNLPGTAARIVVEPGDGYGHAAINLQMDEDGWQFTTTLDNFGRESLGEHRLGLHMLANNPFTLGDTFQASLLVSEGSLLRYANLTYGLPIFSLADRLHFTLNRADYEAGAEFAALGVVGENNFAEIGYRHAFSRTANGEWHWQAALRRFDSFSEVTTLPIAPSENELDIAEIGIGVRQEGARGQFSALLRGSGNGRTNQSSVFELDGDAQEFKLDLTLQAAWVFAPRWWLLAQAEASYSRHPLVNSQQFSLGGPKSVRGYEPAVLRGDVGYRSTLELHRGIEWFTVPGSISLQLDHGRSFRRLLIGEPESQRGHSVHSAGLGLQLGDDEGFQLNFTVHHPLGSTPDPLAIDTSTKVWASVGYQF